MISFRDYISENYKNFIGPNSKNDREKWADEVWKILNLAYAPIGGVKGNGFNSKQDMIDNIPFWKIYTKANKVVAAVFYKDKSGRKLVAIASDGSDLGKKIVTDVFKNSFGVAYGEFSGAALGVIMKNIDPTSIQNLLLPPKRIEQLIKEKVIPLNEYDKKKLSDADVKTLRKFEMLSDFFYVRNVGGKDILKIALGSPNIPIK